MTAVHTHSRYRGRPRHRETAMAVELRNGHLIAEGTGSGMESGMENVAVMAGIMAEVANGNGNGIVRWATTGRNGSNLADSTIKGIHHEQAAPSVPPPREETPADPSLI
jgi:hypothetical protein